MTLINIKLHANAWVNEEKIDFSYDGTMSVSGKPFAFTPHSQIVQNANLSGM